MATSSDGELDVAVELWTSIKANFGAIKSLVQTNPRVADSLLRRAMLANKKLDKILRQVPTGLSAPKEAVARTMQKEIKKRLGVVPEELLGRLRAELV